MFCIKSRHAPWDDPSHSRLCADDGQAGFELLGGHETIPRARRRPAARSCAACPALTYGTISAESKTGKGGDVGQRSHEGKRRRSSGLVVAHLDVDEKRSRYPLQYGISYNEYEHQQLPRPVPLAGARNSSSLLIVQKKIGEPAYHKSECHLHQSPPNCSQ